MTALLNLLQHIEFPDTEMKLNQAQRLFHGRGHAYPGLQHVCVDWLPPVLLITLYKEETGEAIIELADALHLKLSGCRSVQVQLRYQCEGPARLVRGEAIQQWPVDEQGLKFQITLGRNRNTGLFLDMRNGRDWVRRHSYKQRVLNLFAYTCGFSVAAVAGGALSVVNVDMSSAALATGRQNHILNLHPLDAIRFEKLNIFKSFGRLKKRGPYDLLICDPPTFQKGSVDSAKDYPKIIRRLPELMAPGASLLLCMNSPHHGLEFITDMMQTHAADYQLHEEIKAPAVFRDAHNRGLKVLHFEQA